MKDLPVYLNDHPRRDRGQVGAERLMKRFEMSENSMRKAGAGVMEKRSNARLSIGDAGDPNLKPFQSLEAREIFGMELNAET